LIPRSRSRPRSVRVYHTRERAVLRPVKTGVHQLQPADAEWLEKLKKFLKPLENEDKIKIWDDKEIKPGDQWEEEIEKSISAAKAAVLLVTQDFLTSKFISENELPLLLAGANERGVEIFWIAVSSSTYEDTELSKYQSVNDPENPLDTLDPPAQNKELKKIYSKIKNVIE
jgi:hypothetical protein